MHKPSPYSSLTVTYIYSNAEPFFWSSAPCNLETSVVLPDSLSPECKHVMHNKCIIKKIYFVYTAQHQRHRMTIFTIKFVTSTKINCT